METVLRSKTAREIASSAMEHWKKQGLAAEGRTDEQRATAHANYVRALRIYRVASIDDVHELHLNDQDLEACLG